MRKNRMFGFLFRCIINSTAPSQLPSPIVGVQRVNLIQQALLRRFDRQPNNTRFDPRLFASPMFVSHVDMAGRIFANQDRHQAGCLTARIHPIGDIPANFLSDLHRNPSAIQNTGGAAAG